MSYNNNSKTWNNKEALHWIEYIQRIIPYTRVNYSSNQTILNVTYECTKHEGYYAPYEIVINQLQIAMKNNNTESYIHYKSRIEEFLTRRKIKSLEFC